MARPYQAVERGLEDWLEIAGVATDRGDGDDQVEELLEGEVVADLVSALPAAIPAASQTALTSSV
jgi:hypothetical protein